MGRAGDLAKRKGEPFLGRSTIYGVDAQHETPYLTRAWIGRLRLHIFHRGDADPDPHDHPWGFITFPLTSYVEEVYDPSSGARKFRVVRAWRFHRRRADFAHRVIGRYAGGGDIGYELGADVPAWVPRVLYGRKIVTIVWRARGGRAWGFWRDRNGDRCWVPWKRYVYEGGRDAACAPTENHE